MRRKIVYLTIVILAIGVSVAAGQSDGGAPKVFSFKADNGAAEGSKSREEISLDILQGPDGYEVGGYMLLKDNYRCYIKGTYYPSTGRLAATCAGKKIDAFRINNGDALQITEPWSAVAWRDGAKRPPKRTGSDNS